MVAIKDFEMPEKCCGCELAIPSEDYYYYGEHKYECVFDGSSIDLNSTERLSWCPLINVKGDDDGADKTN